MEQLKNHNTNEYATNTLKTTKQFTMHYFDLIDLINKKYDTDIDWMNSEMTIDKILLDVTIQ